MSDKPKRVSFGGRPFRSKLVPYEAHIRRWLKAGKTYAQIAEVLHHEHGVKASKSAINHFVIVRHRGGGRRAMLPDPEPGASANLSLGSQDTTPDYYPPADPANL